jgi:Mg/Co/Ni transporter MgtE
MNSKKIIKHKDYPFEESSSIDMKLEPIKLLQLIFKINKGEAKVLLYIIQKNLSSNIFFYLNVKRTMEVTEMCDMSVRKALFKLISINIIAASEKANVYYINQCLLQKLNNKTVFHILL